ncbi:hypothetical protein EBR78_05680 [bacterium]|nr:hypothetical protein [bacterium]
MRGHSFLLFILLLAFPLEAHGQNRLGCLGAFERLSQMIGENHFETRRDFENYARFFPQSFLDSVSLLRAEGHWIDAGSGEGFAVEDFFKGYVLDPVRLQAKAEGDHWSGRRTLLNSNEIIEAATRLNYVASENKPKVTAVTFAMERNPPKTSPKLAFKTGRFLEEIPNSEFSKADIITDLFGVASYSPRLDDVLRKYHDLLKLGGRAYIFIGDYIETPDAAGGYSNTRVGEPGWDAPFAQSQVKQKNGDNVPLIEWLRNLPGFQVTVEHRRVEQKTRPGILPGSVLRSTIVLEKTSPDGEIPKLKLIFADDGKPPIRRFQEIDQ